MTTMKPASTETTPRETAVLPGLVTALRLPSVARHWKDVTETADSEGWPAVRVLETLFDLEVTERAQRRIQRHFHQAALPPGKTFATFDFQAAPGLRKTHALTLASGGTWIKNGANILAFGPSGVGKSHLAAATAAALIEAGYRTLFTRTIDLVQKLQAARRDLALTALLDKLDKFDLLVLDDFSYVRKDQAETSVLFELIAHRYERRSLLITANQPFSTWDQIFPDPAMTVAAIDRLVHHATIFEMNGESFRRRTAMIHRGNETALKEP